MSLQCYGSLLLWRGIAHHEVEVATGHKLLVLEEEAILERFAIDGDRLDIAVLGAVVIGDDGEGSPLTGMVALANSGRPMV